MSSHHLILSKFYMQCSICSKHNEEESICIPCFHHFLEERQHTSCWCNDLSRKREREEKTLTPERKRAAIRNLRRPTVIPSSVEASPNSPWFAPTSPALRAISPLCLDEDTRDAHAGSEETKEDDPPEQCQYMYCKDLTTRKSSCCNLYWCYPCWYGSVDKRGFCTSDAVVVCEVCDKEVTYDGERLQDAYPNYYF